MSSKSNPHFGGGDFKLAPGHVGNVPDRVEQPVRGKVLMRFETPPVLNDAQLIDQMGFPEAPEYNPLWYDMLCVGAANVVRRMRIRMRPLSSWAQCAQVYADVAEESLR